MQQKRIHFVSGFERGFAKYALMQPVEHSCQPELKFKHRNFQVLQCTCTLQLTHEDIMLSSRDGDGRDGSLLAAKATHPHP